LSLLFRCNDYSRHDPKYISRGTGSIYAATPGPWSTARFEIARGLMLAVLEPGVKTLTVKSCTQLMKTELLLNALGYLIHQAPCPILYVLPKEQAVKAFSRERQPDCDYRLMRVNPNGPALLKPHLGHSKIGSPVFNCPTLLRTYPTVSIVVGGNSHLQS
jgi:hypothetical protein